MKNILGRFSLAAAPLLLAGCASLTSAPPPPPEPTALKFTGKQTQEVVARIRNLYNGSFISSPLSEVGRFVDGTTGATLSLDCTEVTTRESLALIARQTSPDMQTYKRFSEQIAELANARDALDCPKLQVV